LCAGRRSSGAGGGAAQPGDSFAESPRAAANSIAGPSLGGGRRQPSGVSDGGAAAAADVGALLNELRVEQARLRQEFARQAELVQRMQARGTPEVREGRDAAWADLKRIRQRLEDSDAELATLGASPGGGGDALDRFVVSTRMLPADACTIPSRPATPGGAAAWGHAAGGGAGSRAAKVEQSLDGLAELLRSHEQAQMLFPADGSGEDAGLYTPPSQLPAPPTRIPRRPEEMGGAAGPRAPQRAPESQAILHGGAGVNHAKAAAAAAAAADSAPKFGRRAASSKPPMAAAAAKGSAAFAKPTGGRTVSSARVPGGNVAGQRKLGRQGSVQ